MARNWTTDETLADIIKRMEEYGPNVAEFPIAMTRETSDMGELVWVVNLHVRIKRVTEFEIEAMSTILADALRKAYIGLNNPNGVMNRARDGNEAFNVSY